MIRSYPFAMVFAVSRMIIPLPPVVRLGVVGIETVVWTVICPGCHPAEYFPGLASHRGAAGSSGSGRRLRLLVA
jgi:hypothetical protein